MALEAFAIGASAIWLLVGVYWFWIAGRIPSLPNRHAESTGVMVSVVVTACNEAETIGPALASLLALPYRPIEVIVVNDRSTDATGTIIDELISNHDHAKVIHNDHLPQGWLGKVHALHLGAKASTGSWILFTDADVVYSKTLLADAVAHAEAKSLDHFSLLPRMIVNTWALDITICAFTQLGCHKVFGLCPIPFGAGAFNMVRRETLNQSEGLAWLKMEVADDAGLALLIANSGGKTEIRTAIDRLEIMWYPTLQSMFSGLEKNSGVLISQGQPWRLFVMWMVGSALVSLPFIGTLLEPNLWPSLLLGMGAYIIATMRLRLRLKTGPWLALLAPLGFILVGTCGLWSMIQIMRRGGIDWRGTFYPWSKLKKGQRVRL